MKKKGSTVGQNDPKAYFLHLLGLSQKELAALVARVLQGAEDGELYLERTDFETISFDDGRIESPERTIEQGFGLRCVNGISICYASGNIISAAEIEKAGKELSEVADGKGKYIPAAPSKAKQYYATKDMLTLPLFHRVHLLKHIDAHARKDPLVANVSVQLIGVRSRILIVRADGTMTADVRPMSRLIVTTQVSNGKKAGAERREDGNFIVGGRYGYDRITPFPKWKDGVAEAINEAKEKLVAKACPSGEMTVVIGRGWGGVLLHEAVGHPLEGDFLWRNETRFADLIGKRVASDLVTVVDDGTVKDARGSLNRDDEGTPTECTTLIKNGILVGFMHDRQSARLCNALPTGNARRESFEHRPQVRMRNTYMLPGESSPEEIIAKTEQGLYIKSFGGGQVEPITGKFIFMATIAYKIENGKLTDPVIGATLIGNYTTVLKHVDMVGNDGGLGGAGSCGKGGQTVPVGIGQPTIRLSGGVSVGGTETTQA